MNHRVFEKYELWLRKERQKQTAYISAKNDTASRAGGDSLFISPYAPHLIGWHMQLQTKSVTAPNFNIEDTV